MVTKYKNIWILGTTNMVAGEREEQEFILSQKNGGLREIIRDAAKNLPVKNNYAIRCQIGNTNKEMLIGFDKVRR